MDMCLITFASVTPAQRGERMLRKINISCTLHRTPRWMEERGCGYSLQIRKSDAMEVRNYFDRNQVAYRKLYCMRQGQWQEETP